MDLGDLMPKFDNSMIPTVVEDFNSAKIKENEKVSSIPTPILNPSKIVLPYVQQRKQFINKTTFNGGTLLEVKQEQEANTVEPLDLSVNRSVYLKKSNGQQIRLVPVGSIQNDAGSQTFFNQIRKLPQKFVVAKPIIKTVKLENSRDSLPQQGFVRNRKRSETKNFEDSESYHAASILASLSKTAHENDTEKEAVEALLSLSQVTDNIEIRPKKVPIQKVNKYPKIKKLAPCPNIDPQSSNFNVVDSERDLEDVMQCGGPRPMDRLPLRPWLRKVLDLNCAAGVQWIKKDEGKFRVKWKHAARQGFSVDGDAELFKLWAIHTGKFNANKDSPDHKRWKANFRCAINSVSDLAEVKEEMHRQDGETYKVFCFLPEKSKKSSHSNKNSNTDQPKTKKTKIDNSPCFTASSSTCLQTVLTYS